MKKFRNNRWSAALFWAALSVPVLWFGVAIAQITSTDGNKLELVCNLLQNPFLLCWTDKTALFLLFALSLYGMAVSCYLTEAGSRRPREEYGSAKWANTAQINAKYSSKKKEHNVLLTEYVQMSMDTHRHRRNLNTLVVGGSGAGKTRFFVKPNVMQANCSFCITDPKGEILRSLGGLLEQKGYEIKVFDLIEMERSDRFNPFAYLRTDSDAMRLINSLIRNTTPKNASSSDPFWDKAETALLTALILYLLHEAPPEEQNFTTVQYMIECAEVREEQEDYVSALDMLFDELQEQNPEHIAVKEYLIFKQAAGKTAKSILVSAAVRLAAFNLSEVSRITSHDDMDLGSLGERKRAVFALIPDNDTSFNYLVGMLYTSIFSELYRKADREHGGRLPVPVRLIMDEFPNVALPDDFEKILATMRSREISCSIIIQNIAQLKGLFKDNWESLIGNCDEFLYLGGNEKETHKYISELLGKASIDTKTHGQTKGRSGSYSTNFQSTGRELMQPDEVRLLPNEEALLFIRGERPVRDFKIDLMRHPNIKLTQDGGAPPYEHGDFAPLAFDDLTVGGNPEDLELFEMEGIFDEKTE